MTSPFLDPEPISAERFRNIARSAAELLDTRNDVVLMPGEAVLALEAAARGLGGPGVHALNLVTSVYGGTFGAWMKEGGTKVLDIAAAKGEGIDPEVVRRTLSEHPDISLVSFVHVEAISGVRNDAEAISAIARAHGALVVLDAVASVGADVVRLDSWGIDMAVVGPQKALAGPAGISVATLSERAWLALAANPRAPRTSMLSLLDWKERWIDLGYASIPTIVAPLEVLALEVAIDRVRHEGLDQVQRRHHRAAGASRAGALALGLALCVRDRDAASVVTTLRAPSGVDARIIVQRAQSEGPVALSAGYGDLAEEVIRVDHTGQRAQLNVVRSALVALARALGVNETSPERVAAALDAASDAWNRE
jgi:aspartate aminotransferase-like enzyme